MKKILTLLFFLIIVIYSYSQSVGIGKTIFTPFESAALEIRANNKGLLIPRMTYSDKSLIQNPSKGLLIYQIDLIEGFYYYTGSKWQLLGGDFKELDGDSSNEIQVISISQDTIYLSNGGGFVKLPKGTINTNELHFEGTKLSITNGNIVDLLSLKDNLGNHIASKNIVLSSNYISNDGDSEGIKITNNGSVLFTGDVSVLGEINFKDGSINTSDIADGAITGDKISVMNATINSFLKWDGLRWSSGLISDKSITYSKLQNATGSSGTILQWNGVKWVELNVSSLLMNEVQDIELTNLNILGLTKSDVSVDLNKYLDNTDSQNLNLTSNILSLSGGVSNINLSIYKDNTDNQELSLNGNVLSISGGTNTVDFSTMLIAYDHNLNLIGDNLSNGSSSVNLGSYKQSLSLSNNILSIGLGNSIDLSPLFLLNLEGTNLGILGNSGVIDLSVIKDDLGNHTATELLKLGINKIGFGVLNNGLSFSSNGDAIFTGEVKSENIVTNDIKLGLGSINREELADGAVSLSKIYPLNAGQFIMGTVGGNTAITVSGDIGVSSSGVIEIKNDVISTSKILDGTIGNSDLSDASISSVKLENMSVLSSKLANSSVINSKLANGSVTSSKINQMSASVGQFLAWNGNSWTPKNLNVDGTLDYKGVWDATQNIPNITSTSGSKGDFYVVSKAGNIVIDSESIVFYVGDWLLKNDTKWERVRNSNSVVSVHGRSGDISSAYGDYTWSQIDKTISSIDDITDVNSTNSTLGQILISDGINWNNREITGDVSLIHTGQLNIGDSKITSSKIKDDAVSYSKFQDAVGSVNTIIMWNGSRWVESFVSALEEDGSITNEIQTLSLKDNNLSLSIDNSTVSLVDYLDNTDSQSLSLSGTRLSISNGNNVDLSSFVSTDNQELSLVGNTLNLTRSAEFVDLKKYQQSLSLNTVTNILSISGENNVDLSVYKDNTDLQDLVLTGDILSLTGDVTKVNLNKYLDNTDSQFLSLTGNNLSISGGNTINLEVLNTDNQTISLAGTMLLLSGGNKIDLVSLKDDLGNHSATTNILLNGNYLSNNGGNNGLKIDNTGKISASNNLYVTGDISIGISNSDNSAVVTMSSNTKGFLPPRMTSNQRQNIRNPAIGLVVFDTNKNNLYIYTGIWTEIGVPIGSIQAFVGMTIPDGWMLCNGSTFSSTIYKELYNVLGSTVLPDFRGVFLRGLDSGRGLDLGRKLMSYQVDELKSHNHIYTDNSSYNLEHISEGTSVSSSNVSDVKRTTNSLGGLETRPKNVAVNYIIRVK